MNHMDDTSPWDRGDQLATRPATDPRTTPASGCRGRDLDRSASPAHPRSRVPAPGRSPRGLPLHTRYFAVGRQCGVHYVSRERDLLVGDLRGAGGAAGARSHSQPTTAAKVEQHRRGTGRPDPRTPRMRRRRRHWCPVVQRTRPSPDPPQFVRDIGGTLPARVRRPSPGTRGRAARAPAASGRSDDSDGGSCVKIAATTLASLSPANARLPVSICRAPPERKQIRPRVGRVPLQLFRRHVRHRPHHAPARWPAPRAESVTLRPARGRGVSFASPKSSSFDVQRAAVLTSMTLPGFRSRCTMPCWCAALSASAICAPQLERLRQRQRAVPAAARASGPRGSSITRKSWGRPSQPMSCSTQMCGWFSAEAARASCSKRARARGRARACAGRTLIATVRARGACRAPGTLRPCRPRRAGRRSHKGRGGCQRRGPWASTG